MSESKNTIIGNFTREKTIQQDKDLTRKVRVTFYRTKPGCYTPPPYQLKYRELSKVLK